MKPRHPDRLCWRMAAIYRCCIRFGKTKAWALDKIREAAPDGKRDHLATLWFYDIDRIRDFRRRTAATHAPELAMAA